MSNSVAHKVKASDLQIMSSKTYLVLIHIFTLTNFFKSFYSHTRDIYRGVHSWSNIVQSEIFKKVIYFEYDFIKIDISRSSKCSPLKYNNHKFEFGQSFSN